MDKGGLEFESESWNAMFANIGVDLLSYSWVGRISVPGYPSEPHRGGAFSKQSWLRLHEKVQIAGARLRNPHSASRRRSIIM